MSEEERVSEKDPQEHGRFSEWAGTALEVAGLASEVAGRVTETSRRASKVFVRMASLGD